MTKGKMCPWAKGHPVYCQELECAGCWIYLEAMYKEQGIPEKDGSSEMGTKTDS